MTENDQTSGTAAAQTPPPPPPPERPPLRRSVSDRKIAGVAGGLGRYFDIDPLIFRVVLVVLAVFGGSGLLLYAIGWLLIPEEGTSESDGQRLISGRATPKVILAIILGVIGLAAVGNLLDTGFGFGGLAALAAIGLAALIISRSDQSGGQTPRPHAPAAPAAPAPTAPYPPYGAYGQTPGMAYSPGPPTGFSAPPTFAPPPGPTAQPPPPPAPPPVPRERSYLGRLTVSAALLVAGILVGWDVSTSSHDVDAAVIFGSALAVVGLGLLVGSFVGRARGLIGLGVVLAILTMVTALADLNVRGGTGEREWTPLTVSEIDSPYRLGAGQARLDMSNVVVPLGETVEVRASVGAGQLTVLVPDDVDLTIDAHAGIGNITMPDGEGPNGIDAQDDFNERAVAAGGAMELDVEVGLGSLEVRRAAS